MTLLSHVAILCTALSSAQLIEPNQENGEIRKQAIKKEIEKLKGQWAKVSGIFDGAEWPASQVKSESILITEDKMIFKVSLPNGAIGNQEASYTVDPTTKPKTIDVTYRDSSGKNHRILGIYELGDKLKLCFGFAERPKAFESKPESQHTLDVYQQDKGK